jgi:hypothetical protein
VVFDRAFNTAAMLAMYYSDQSTSSFLQRIDWNIDDPNVLQLDMPGYGVLWVGGIKMHIFALDVHGAWCMCGSS